MAGLGTKPGDSSRGKRFLPQSRLCFSFLLLLALTTGVAIGIVIGVYVIERDKDDRKPVQATVAAQAAKSASLSTRQFPNSQNSQRTARATLESQRTDSFQKIVRCPCLNNAKGSCMSCRTRNPFVKGGQSANESCFAQLTTSEMSKAYTILRKGGFVDIAKTLRANRVYQMYLYPMAKEEVLGFLDNGAEFPGRFAVAHVYRGGRVPADVMEYKIGPLHESDDRIKVEQILKAGDIPFNRRPQDPIERRYMLDTVRPHVAALKPLLQDSFDGKYYGNDVALGFSIMPSFHGDDRVSVMDMYFKRAPGGRTMHLLPVQCQVHHAGVEVSKWHASDFYYLGQGPFASGQALYEAYCNGLLRKNVLPKGYFTEKQNAYRLTKNESSLPKRQHAAMPPPQTYEPEGPRYSIRGPKIEWMGWSFEFSTDPFRGPGVFDLRFKGQRIAYQISLQDITLMYASGSTGAGVAPSVISDAVYLLGGVRGPPRIGLDCPDRANTINTTLFVSHGGVVKQAACVFEADGQKPLWRHYDSGTTYGLVSSHLVVRSPMNLGNYDYSAEWKFYLDGHVETIVSASGYLYASVWDAGNPIFGDKSNTPLGYRIGDRIIGSIHDHSLLFKVDVDVLGRNNSFEVIRWKSSDVVSALNSQKGINIQEKPPMFPFNFTRYIAREIVNKELGLNIDSLNPAIWTIVNENERNSWGVMRGYQIVPMTSEAETMTLEHPMFGAWRHVNNHCSVTKYKDSELYGTSSIYDIFQPNKPIGGLQAMLDGEDIRNEDLVAWVTAKFMHAPTSEDVPMTLGVERGFSLKPFNYFDRSPTFDIQGHYQKKDPFEYAQC